MPRQDKYYSLEFVRGVAALLVAVLHFYDPIGHSSAAVSRLNSGLFFDLWEYCNNRFHFTAGVDIFFVLSGFVIAMCVARYSSAPAFFWNRVLRIVPEYWFATTIYAALVIGLTVGFGIEGKLSLQFLRENVACSYFFYTCKEAFPILSVGWTLVFEMYFYLVAGIVIFARGAVVAAMPAALHVLRRPETIGLLLLPAAIGFVFVAPKVFRLPYPGFLGAPWNPLVFEFVAGVFLYWLAGQYRNVLQGRAVWVSGAVLMLLGIFLMPGAHNPENDFVRIKEFLLPSALIVFGALMLEDVVACAGEKAIAICTVFGIFSYSLYLEHPIAKMMITYLFGGIHTDVLFVVYMVVTLFLAAATSTLFFRMLYYKWRV